MRQCWVAALLVLTACGSGKTFVEAPSTAQQRYSLVSLHQAPSTVTVPVEVQTVFVNALRNKIYAPQKFSQGTGLAIEISYIQYEEGDRMKRYLAGFTSWGASSLSVRAVFRDSATGQEIGRVLSEGNINGGLLGGSQDDAVEKVAEEVADFAAKNYLLGATN